MEPTTTTNRPSGIPRASKLPVLRNRSSQLFIKSGAGAELVQPSNPTPKLQKRSSIAVFPRKEAGGLQEAAATSSLPSSRNPASRTAPHAGKLSTSSRSGVVRPSSRANQQRLPPIASKSTKPEDEENHDQLGSLNAFRTGSRPGSRDESPVEAQETNGSNDGPVQPRDRAKSRPSLSDRTIESLQGLPSTPKERRRSSFFSQVESPMGPPLRPASSLSRTGSSRSRPGTSDGTLGKPAARPSSPVKPVSASAKPATRTISGGFGFTPSSAKRRSVSTAFSTKLQGAIDPVPPVPPLPTATSPVKQTAAKPSISRPLMGSKTIAARSSKPRPALGSAFDATPSNGAPAVAPPQHHSQRVISNPPTSSAALRQQIAAAKAAARKERTQHHPPLQDSTSNFENFNADIHTDPFNLAPKDDKHILRNRIRSARTDGKLNIAGMELKRIPDEVMQMYDPAAMDEANVNWAEVVDLTRFIAADNEIDDLGDCFPDKSAEELAEDEEDSQGNQFGGLEMLDLHGNALATLPLGLRRLERLTILNLAHNKLENACLDILGQIVSLKELKMGHNHLAGQFPAAVCRSLTKLETLDLQSNRLLGLPDAVKELTSLRVLNVSSNQLTALPMEAIQQMTRLVELDASCNALIGSLFPLGGGVSAHASLESLNVAHNSLAALTFSSTLSLPKLKILDVTNNHLTLLPPVSGWTNLITVTAGDNKIEALPEGFARLRKLRNANFSGNEIRLLDPEIARMERLESLILAQNPLRDKRYLSMGAEDIKRDLRARLGDGEGEGGEGREGEVSDPETVIAAG